MPSGEDLADPLSELALQIGGGEVGRLQHPVHERADIDPEAHPR